MHKILCLNVSAFNVKSEPALRGTAIVEPI
jgi:hypothetical protein